MHRPTWGWTRRHLLVGLLLVCALGTSMVGLLEPAPIPLWIAAAAAACVLFSLAFDAYGGILVALVCASFLVGARKLTGLWTSDVFVTAAIETGALLLVGAVAGAVGRMLRVGSTTATRSWSMLEPVYGSLGLIGPDAALARLEEEVERATKHRRALSVVIFDAHLRRTDLDEQGRSAALRAVARIVETRAGDVEVPFALAADRVGWILPEVSSARAWEAVGVALDAVAEARFTFGTARTRQPLDDAVDIQVGITQLGPGRDTAEALLDAAVQAAQLPAHDIAPALMHRSQE